MPQSDLTKKVLRSGLVDKATAELMEKWGYLQPGSAEEVNETALEGATKETLHKLAEDLDQEVEKHQRIRETSLDLDRLKWPTAVSIHLDGKKHSDVCGPSSRSICCRGPRTPTNIPAVMDRMGRYYFRIQDVDPDWFVPGYELARENHKEMTNEIETILESQVLYIDETPVCIQVSTRK